jgi:hypothetical protein
MQSNPRDPDDFTLRIVVTAPERRVDEQAPTRPFMKNLYQLGDPSAPLPGRPRPGAAPLSIVDEARAQRRQLALRRIAWAQSLLRRFGFAP